MNAILDRLRGGLVVSVQADAGSPLNTPETIALLARCAAQNGAAGVRVEGSARLAAVVAAIPLPVIGIVKREHAGFAPYITSTFGEIAEVASTGAAIVAFDATGRVRAGNASVAALVAAAHAHGMLAMADCASEDELVAAAEAGADLVATTLAGYTAETEGRGLPAVELVAGVARRHPFVVCEGGVGVPDDVRAAFAAGASAVVVGTAITNVDALVRRFVAAAPRAT